MTKGGSHLPLTQGAAVYGPVRTVVWQGSAGDRRPYADQTPLSDNGMIVGFGLLGLYRPVHTAGTHVRRRAGFKRCHWSGESVTTSPRLSTMGASINH